MNFDDTPQEAEAPDVPRLTDASDDDSPRRIEQPVDGAIEVGIERVGERDQCARFLRDDRSADGTVVGEIDWGDRRELHYVLPT